MLNFIKCYFIYFSLFIYLCCCETDPSSSTECKTPLANPPEEVKYYSDQLKVVVLDFNDLKIHKNLQPSISEAYGPDGLGILLVKNVPNLQLLRNNLLRLSYNLSHLSDEDKKSMEHEISHYSVGWSHGKEKLAKNMPDYSKGSFYANPLIDVPTLDENLVNNYPAFYHSNIWPSSNIESLKLLRSAFMELGTLIYNVGQLIAQQMDDYTVSVRPSYEKYTLKNAVGSKIPKGRLLYYYSPYETELLKSNVNSVTTNSATTTNNDNNEDYIKRVDSWCGWHNDHSALTGLALGMFFDENGKVLNEMDDPYAGLYIKTRNNQTYHINIKDADNYLGFQIGETSQILSGGALLATPHAVMGPLTHDYHKASRSSFAVFMQPDHTHHMRSPNGVELSIVQFDRFLPPNVIPLKTRWSNATNDTFGQFTSRTLATYY